MPNYHYRCTCGYEFEVYQSIKDKRLKLCPECNTESLQTVLYGGIGGFVDGGVNTLGKLAEHNSKKMGKYALSELAEKTPKNDGRVAYTDRELRKKINKMSPEQKQRYIMEGK